MSLRPRYLISALMAVAALVSTAPPAAATPITFDPTVNTFTSIGGFTGTFTAAPTFVVGEIRFQAGRVSSTPTSFTMTSISLVGDGLVSPLTFPDLNIVNNPGSLNSSPFEKLTANPLPTTVDYASYSVSFNIAANTFKADEEFRLRFVALDSEGNIGFSTYVNLVAVPEPGTLAMLAAGGAALGGVVIRRRRKR